MVGSVLTALRTGNLKGCHGQEPSFKLKKTSLFSGSSKLATRFLVHLCWVIWLSPKKLGTQNKNSSASPATSCLISETATSRSSTHSSLYLGEGNIWTHALASLPSYVWVLFSVRSEGGRTGASEPCRCTFSCCLTQCLSAVTVSALLGGCVNSGGPLWMETHLIWIHHRPPVGCGVRGSKGWGGLWVFNAPCHNPTVCPKEPFTNIKGQGQK